MSARTVVLRQERNGPDSRFLSARLDANGALKVDGQDLGPGTAPVSSDGEYEWSQTFPPDSIPALRSALGGNATEDILDLLEREYKGPSSYELERIMRDTADTIPREFWSWSG